MGVWSDITGGAFTDDDVLPDYATSATPDEEAAGFVVVETSAGPGVVRHVDERICVIKMLRDPLSRDVIYAVVDRRLMAPITGFRTLRALLDRFPVLQ